MAFEKDMVQLTEEDINALIRGLGESESEESESEETSLDDAIRYASRRSSGLPMITAKHIDDTEEENSPKDSKPVYKPHTDLLGGYGSNENENNNGKNLGEKK